MESIIEECKKRYPIGTKVRSLFHSNNPILTIKYGDFMHVRKDGVHVSSNNSLLAVVYEDGVYADIVDEDGNVISSTSNSYEIY
jgi:hypothetical protein